jgi:hypothetical protein
LDWKFTVWRTALQAEVPDREGKVSGYIREMERGVGMWRRGGHTVSELKGCCVDCQSSCSEANANGKLRDELGGMNLSFELQSAFARPLYAILFTPSVSRARLPSLSIA